MWPNASRVLTRSGFSLDSQRSAAFALVTIPVSGCLTSWVIVADSSPAVATLFIWLNSETGCFGIGFEFCSGHFVDRREDNRHIWP